jgi:hypothetical protein
VARGDRFRGHSARRRPELQYLALARVRVDLETVDAVQVDTESWEQAFTTLTSAGLQVLLAGRSVRCTDTSAAEVEQVLETAGLSTRVTVVPQRGS